MPHTTISGKCPHCQKDISQRDVWYNLPEEVSANTTKYVSKGLFIFGLTGFLFVWGLVLMCKEYDMRRITTLLSNPDVHVEEATYSASSKEVNSDTTRIVRPSNKHLSEVNVRLQEKLDQVQKEFDQMKEVSSKDRARVRDLEVKLHEKEALKKEK